MSKSKKNIYIAISLSTLIVVCLILYTIFKYNNTEEDNKIISSKYINFVNSSYEKITNYLDYQEFSKKNDYSENELTEESFDKNIYVFVTYLLDDCSEKLNNKYYQIDNNILNIYFEFDLSCGACESKKHVIMFEIPKTKKFKEIKLYQSMSDNEFCEPDITYKPMIYIYPEKEMDLTIKLGNKNLITHTYPKYDDAWNVRVSKDSNVYDYNTKRNYYALYWEAIDNTKNDMKKGFVIKGTETIKFLEEKLSLLGLNEREINEFIVYWINKLENNNYNYIYFRTTEEVNNYMSLSFSETPDTIIRIIMDFKALDEYVKIENQNLTKQERNGFTIVEWGGRELK